MQNWIEEHPEVVRMFWPARSPDLNPMENVWERVVLDWDKVKEHQPDGLDRHVKDVWEVLRSPEGVEFCASLVDSMPERLRDIVAAKGKYAKVY